MTAKWMVCVLVFCSAVFAGEFVAVNEEIGVRWREFAEGRFVQR